MIIKFPSFRIAVVLLLFCSGVCFGQYTEVKISKGVFLGDPAIEEVYTCWLSYLKSGPNNSCHNPLWNSEENAKYFKSDLLNSWSINPGIYSRMGEYKPTVLGIYPEGEYFRIRTLFSRQIDSGFSDPLAITDVYAKKINGIYALYNALPINTKDWQHHTIGNITFICPQYHTFNKSLALKLDQFADSLALRFGETPKHIDYYFADTYDELTHARGFEYIMGEGNTPHPQGYSEVHNNIVTAAGAGEWYPHEFIHMYAFTPFPAADVMLHEGLATYFGGSHNHSLNWLIKRADSLLDARSDLDINSLFANPQNKAFDYEVSSNYLFGGIIAKMIYEKGGWDMLKQMMAYGQLPQQGRFKVLKDFFNVDVKDAGMFMRKKIAEYAKSAGSELVLKMP